MYEDPETFGQYHLSYRTGDIVSPKIDTAEPIVVELEDFAAAVRAGGIAAGHLELARNVARLTEAAENRCEADGSLVVARARRALRAGAVSSSRPRQEHRRSRAAGPDWRARIAEAHLESETERLRRAVAFGFGRRDYLIRRLLAVADASSVVIALLATVVISDRVTTQAPPAPGACCWSRCGSD